MSAYDYLDRPFAQFTVTVCDKSFDMLIVHGDQWEAWIVELRNGRKSYTQYAVDFKTVAAYALLGGLIIS